MRGIAAIIVMLYHADVIFGISTPFSRGYLFVDFFFLLSGFVLTLSVEHKLRQHGKGAEFLWARVKRLWPLTTVGTVVGAAVALFIGNQDGATLSVTLALLMIPSFRGTGQLFPLNGPQWSLFLELVANVLHTAVLWRFDDRQLRTAVLVSAVGLAVTIMTFGANTVGPFAFNWQWALPRVAFSYTLGIWFARQWSSCPRVPLISWRLAFVLPVVCVIALPGLPVTLAISDMVVTIMLMPALFWAAALAPVPRRAEAWLGRLGSVSFPLYAIHLPILDAIASIDRGVLSMFLAIGISITGALLLTRLNAIFLTRSRVCRLPIRSSVHVS